MNVRNADYEGFFSKREWLRHAYQYAKATRISPWGFAGALLARVCALTPPNVVAQVTPYDLPMSLNALFALVGPTGSGKGKCMAHSRHLIPAPLPSPLVEVKPKTGESIPAKYVTKIGATDHDGKPIKGEYVDKLVSDRCLVFMPEIVSLRAAMSKQGSTLLPALLEGFSNEPLGDDTKGKQYQIKLPPYSYRLSAVVGVQPSNADTLFAETNTGLAGRFIYLPSTDTDMPALDDKPGIPLQPFPFDPDRLPEGNSFEQIEALLKFGSREAMPQHGATGYPLTTLAMPEQAYQYADDLQRKAGEGRMSPLDTHRVELVAKLAALFRLMEQSDADTLTVTEEDWVLALCLMERSDSTRSQCMEQQRDSVVESRAEYAAAKMDAQDMAEARRLETVKRRVMKILDDNDPGCEGMKGRIIRQKCGKYGKQANAAIEALFDAGKIERVTSGYTIGTSVWSITPGTVIDT